MYATVPVPEPWPPNVITSHAALLLAVQLHSPDAVTENVPEPPSLVNVALPGVRS
jgi:hypothetical protein